MDRALDLKDLRLPFDGSNIVERSFSQAGQDLFVLALLNGKRNGTYVELGCNHPFQINNTFLLEALFGWNGISFDIGEEYKEMWAFRRLPMEVGDARKLDWDSIAERLGTSHIDYLSLDLEPPEVTLECLRNIPLDLITFGVITFEHDEYRAGGSVRSSAREIFDEYGYLRVCSDVMLGGSAFEDWYCDPAVVEASRTAALTSDRKDWHEILFLE